MCPLSRRCRRQCCVCVQCSDSVLVDSALRSSTALTLPQRRMHVLLLMLLVAARNQTHQRALDRLKLGRVDERVCADVEKCDEHHGVFIDVCRVPVHRFRLAIERATIAKVCNRPTFTITIITITITAVK